MTPTKQLVLALINNGINALDLYNAVAEYINEHSIKIPTLPRSLGDCRDEELRGIAQRLKADEDWGILHANRDDLLTMINAHNTESFLVTYTDDEIHRIAEELEVEESDIIFANSRADNIKALFDTSSEEEIREAMAELFDDLETVSTKKVRAKVKPVEEDLCKSCGLLAEDCTCFDDDEDDSDLFFPDFITDAPIPVLRETIRGLGLSDGAELGSLTVHQLWTKLAEGDERVIRDMIEVNTANHKNR